MNEINNPALSPQLNQLTGVDFLNHFIGVAITLFLIVGGIIVLFLFLWGGIQWMLAGGDKNATEAARGRITSALIGALILFSAFAIIKLIEIILSINLLTIDVSPLLFK